MHTNRKNDLFAPVIKLPDRYDILDLSVGPYQASSQTYSVGKYNEKRKNMYEQDLFHQGQEARNIHMGIDIGAPVGTPIYTFDDAKLVQQVYRSDLGDYGYCMILEYIWAQDEPLKAQHTLVQNGEVYWALYGHLGAKSLALHPIGTHISKGTQIAYIGNESENGGWTPHLHFQLTVKRPEECDLPGVVSESEYDHALNTYPDPRQVLGPLY
jgi:murein DD-endopeptidase MepM/ murein hydrolase activator NlpD